MHTAFDNTQKVTKKQSADIFAVINYFEREFQYKQGKAHALTCYFAYIIAKQMESTEKELMPTITDQKYFAAISPDIAGVVKSLLRRGVHYVIAKYATGQAVACEMGLDDEGEVMAFVYVSM